MSSSSPAWSDPSFYTVDDPPPTIARLAAGEPASQRADAHAVGAPGKIGVLDLGLARVGGATRVVRQFQRMPLCALHPLYVDPGWPEMAFLYTVQGGEGIVEGDRYRVDLDCGPGAAAHVTTQAATKIFKMEEGYATQIVNLSAADGAFVELLPDPVMPFRGARFYQRTRMSVDPGATVIFGETLLPGRVARGEVHAYELYGTDTEVRARGGALLFADRLVLEPRSMPSSALRSLGALGPYDVLATLYVVTQRAPARTLVDRLRSALASERDVAAGVSELPNACGVVMRAVGRSSGAMARAVRCAWNAARLTLSGVGAPDLRKP